MLFIASKWPAVITVFRALPGQDRQPFYLIDCHYGAVFMPWKVRWGVCGAPVRLPRDKDPGEWENKAVAWSRGGGDGRQLCWDLQASDTDEQGGEWLS